MKIKNKIKREQLFYTHTSYCITHTTLITPWPKPIIALTTSKLLALPLNDTTVYRALSNDRARVSPCLFSLSSYSHLHASKDTLTLPKSSISFEHFNLLHTISVPPLICNHAFFGNATSMPHSLFTMPLINTSYDILRVLFFSKNIMR